MAMSTQYASARGAFFAPLTTWLQTAREQLARRRNYRRTLRELSTLSPHQLADLGLHRGSLHQTAYETAYHKVR